MNNLRRKKIQTIIDKMEVLKEELNEVCEEEQGYFDNMPEAFQDGDRGDRGGKAQENVDLLEDASSSLDDIIEGLQEAIK